MNGRPGLIVFSDLDGTLLDHDGYGFAPARPALARLKAEGIPLVLASSKTAAEMAGLRQEMGFAHCPAIVENGAGILPAFAGRPEDSASHARLRAALDKLPQALRARFSGFSDWDAATLARLTGLPPAQARLAAKRDFSEPGRFEGSAEDEREFVEALAASGITALHGGRFLTLSFGADKAGRMADIVGMLAPGARTIALGDAPNDRAMIEAADRGVIIPNPAHDGLPPLPGEEDGRIVRARASGPEGWNQSVLMLLDHRQG